MEELKQRVVVKADKIKRYEKRTNQYQQNRMFDNNQKRLFEKLEGKERSENVIPEKHETNEFWRDIWEKDVTHRMDAEWIEGIETEIDIRTPTQQDISVSIEILKKQIKKLPNWKSPGPDGIQGYWVKNFTSIQPILTAMLNDCLISNNIPAWLTKGTTFLIMKDPSKGGAVTN